MSVKDIIMNLVKQGLESGRKCATCPYHLGIIRTFVSPCPSCMGKGMFNSKDIFKDIINKSKR